MSEPAEPAPAPVTAETLSARYDAILNDLILNDRTAKKFRREILLRERRMNEEMHQRHLAVSGLRLHTTRLKKKAEAQLREETGLRALPGFRANVETQAQFRARMNAMRRTVEAEAEKET